MTDVSSDFGHLTTGKALGRVTPRSVEELLVIVRDARKNKTKLTPRGTGYSQGGQSLALGSTCLDLTELVGTTRPSETIVCEGGTRIRDVARAALAVGRLPPALPLNLDMTVGGVLSVGGVGAASFRAGPVVANVVALDVVTGEGELRHVEAGDPLFAAVLCGLGRVGVIARAELTLVRVKPRMRTFCLLYDDLEQWLADQAAVMERADAIEGFFTAAIQGMRNTPRGRSPFAQWFYGLHVGVACDGDPGETVLEGLRPYRRVHVEEDTVENHLFRYQPRFDGMRRTGAWDQAHPWTECFLPTAVLPTLLPQLLDAIPLFLGDGHRLTFVDTRRAPPLFVAPRPRTAAFAILPTGVPPPLADDAGAALARVHDMLIDAGGKRYVSGWLGALKDWRAHYGDAYDGFVGAKRRYDPDGLFTSALFPNG